MSCYCVCHSLSSSRPSCVHCHPEHFIEKADPYCGMTGPQVIADLTKRLEASEAYAKKCENSATMHIQDFGQLVGRAELAERQLSEQREPMACGHPKACWIKANEFSPMAGVGLEGQAIPFEGYCTACAIQNAREKAQTKHWKARENEKVAQAYEWCAEETAACGEIGLSKRCEDRVAEARKGQG